MGTNDSRFAVKRAPGHDASVLHPADDVVDPELWTVITREPRLDRATPVVNDDWLSSKWVHAA